MTTVTALCRAFLLAANVAVVGPAAPVRADSTPAADFRLELTARQPGAPTGLVLRIRFKDLANPDAKPSPQRRVVIAGPDGMRIDGGAIAACRASDAELMALGAGARPADRRVGAGTLTLTTNGGPLLDPFVDDVTLLNGGDDLVELFAKQGTPVRTAVGHRAYAAPNVLAEDTPPQPGGPPSGESSVREIDYAIGAVRGTDGRAFITTPPSCPSGGVWRSTLTFTTADGHSYAASDATPCAAGTPAPSSASRPVPQNASPERRRVRRSRRGRHRRHQHHRGPLHVHRRARFTG